MKILYIAEIVGKAGVYAYKMGLRPLLSRYQPDFVIACADGATGGNGLGRNHAVYIHKLGANIITTGDCGFYKKDLVEYIGKMPYLLRPHNLNPEAPGTGSRTFKGPGGLKLAAAVILGQSGFTRLHGDNPYSRLPALLERLRQESPWVIIDFHAEASAEKQALFALADGGCTAVIGSHTRVQTADERILPGGTAVITDAGRTGSQESVGGSDRQFRIQEYLTGIPEWTHESWERCGIQGVLIESDAAGKALSIKRIQEEVPSPPEAEKARDKDEEHG
jgi:metallophosphoesterase (TIGR00282 family)